MLGVFTDLDHFPDYLVHSRFRIASLKEFFFLCHNTKLSKLYLVLHSYEIVPLLFLIFHLIGWNNFTIGITTGYILHLTVDQFTNMRDFACKPLFYFFTYRLSKGFKRELLVKGKSSPSLPYKDVTLQG